MEPDWIERHTVSGGHDLDYNLVEAAIGSVRTPRGKRFAVEFGACFMILPRGRDEEFVNLVATTMTGLQEPES